MLNNTVSDKKLSVFFYGEEMSEWYCLGVMPYSLLNALKKCE